MHFARAITSLVLGVSAVTAAVLPRVANGTVSNTTSSTNITRPPLDYNSDNFIIRARQLNDSTTVGYMFAEYAYGAGYYATLRSSKSDAIVGHLTDTTNPSNSTLAFGDGQYPQGFVLYPLLSYSNASIAQIFSGQQGTKGVYVNEGGIVDWASQRVSWYACDQALEWGPATAIWYRWMNVTTPRNCVDIQLIAEYAP
ncbi:hypothetical protein E4T42_03553 [Aureobasidium subglaciale]|uniref:DUF7907 domain-containing protein n=1 Tax=Aureobasidium subglaciale (strain EXF-2481) TaxID=1043005 RepID=A0A074YKI5_AURSE|nr:uncharacterized protein AUEXF2481DRAFT_2294 [Aureobasidium subglaciale EXF-2481]KAI5211800.1 hypothetical protein E4T38_01023 [Aureobasidium subglaciale]KAI5230869.1 hypothetical protein E4T40_01024 [Aureobasidium subglaciale]KAI5233952.1 hypothetical protein E4T41_01022 [Aureobasidium subglaciale]KAI5252262.1 hypothetical protein E4T42_03553 [Aureobasidium subglaciale]KAI5267315.1 hypothetical protein E4T46_01022 [Aureobasidium subglaciale]